MSAVHDLVVENMPLARRIARRYSQGDGVDADINQVALLGLVLAARRYDPAAGPFQPFAMATVSGEVKRHLRNTGWSVRVSRTLQERSRNVELAAEALTAELHRSPTPAEIGSRLGLGVEEVLAAARAREAQFASSLDGLEIEATEDDWTMATMIHDAIGSLTLDDQRLLGFRFGDDLSQREIAERLGISQPQVHRRMVGVYDRLRTLLDELGTTPS